MNLRYNFREHAVPELQLLCGDTAAEALAAPGPMLDWPGNNKTPVSYQITKTCQRRAVVDGLGGETRYGVPDKRARNKKTGGAGDSERRGPGQGEVPQFEKQRSPHTMGGRVPSAMTQTAT